MAAMLFGLIVFGVLAMILAILYFRHRNQVLLHQERMAALEKGVAVPAMPAPWSPRVNLLRGLIWSLTGAALIVFLFSISTAMVSGKHTSAEDKAYQAQRLAERLSIHIDQARQMVEQDSAQNGPSPVAVSMLGLIPLAVGVAYLAFYYTDPSRKSSQPSVSG